jgi:rhamnose transport system permease protein
MNHVAGRPRFWSGRSRELGLALIVLVTLAGVAVSFPEFASPGGLNEIFDDTAILVLLALGQTFVLLTRAIDLSVAANIALTGMCVALLNQALPELGIVAIFAIAVLIGAMLGSINGALVWLLEIPSIVVTLGTMAIFRGLVFLLSGGTWVTSNEMTAAFQDAVRAELLGLTATSWFAITGIVIAFLLLRFVRLGRHFYLVGDNPSAAAFIGVNVGMTQFKAFALSGAIAGLCGYLWVARFAVAYTDVALGFELQVIAACVIGGVSIAGGVGTVAGVVLGCVFLGVVKNALPLVGVSPFWQMGVSGLVIVVAVVLNARGERSGRRQILQAPPT